MWIRSQDKKMLANSQALYIHEINKDSLLDKKYYRILDNDFGILGDYATLEKALSVLETLEARICAESNGIPCGVFHMPKDE